MKKIIVLFVLTFSVFSGLFSTEYNDYEKDILEKVLNIRLETKRYETNEENLSVLNDFIEWYDAEISDKTISEEAELTFSNTLAVEKAGLLFTINPKSEEIKPLVMNQYEKNNLFMKNHNIENLNPYYSISRSELNNYAMAFLPKSQIMKFAKQARKDYEDLLTYYPEFSIGLMTVGMMLYTMPAIVGGNKPQGVELIIKSIENAKYNYEIFNTNILYSQILMEEKKNEESRNYFSIAEQIMSDSKYVKLISKINSAGYSFFYYTMHKDKIDAKLGIKN